MSVYRLLVDGEGRLPEAFELYRHDPSLNGKNADALAETYELGIGFFKALFLSKYSLDYIANFFYENQYECRIISFPKKTNTCVEKLALLPGWKSTSVIKALYFESSSDGSLCAVITPEFGCNIDIRNLQKEMNFAKGDHLIRSTCLPQNMIYGTCSPFIVESDLVQNGGFIRYVIFDDESLSQKKIGGGLDDFSFGLDRKLSIQMNYHDCYCMLKERYPATVKIRNISNPSLKSSSDSDKVIAMYSE